MLLTVAVMLPSITHTVCTLHDWCNASCSATQLPSLATSGAAVHQRAWLISVDANAATRTAAVSGFRNSAADGRRCHVWFSCGSLSGTCLYLRKNSTTTSFQNFIFAATSFKLCLKEVGGLSASGNLLFHSS